MIPEPLPPLLRGVGTLLILLTSALVVTVERRDNAERAEQAHLARISLKAERSLSRAARTRMRSPSNSGCCACNCRTTTWPTKFSRTPGSSGWACWAPA